MWCIMLDINLTIKLKDVINYLYYFSLMTSIQYQHSCGRELSRV